MANKYDIKDFNQYKKDIKAGEKNQIAEGMSFVKRLKGGSSCMSCMSGSGKILDDKSLEDEDKFQLNVFQMDLRKIVHNLQRTNPIKSFIYRLIADDIVEFLEGENFYDDSARAQGLKPLTATEKDEQKYRHQKAQLYEGQMAYRNFLSNRNKLGSLTDKVVGGAILPKSFYKNMLGLDGTIELGKVVDELAEEMGRRPDEFEKLTLRLMKNDIKEHYPDKFIGEEIPSISSYNLNFDTYRGQIQRDINNWINKKMPRDINYPAFLPLYRNMEGDLVPEELTNRIENINFSKYVDDTLSNKQFPVNMVPEGKMIRTEKQKIQKQEELRNYLIEQFNKDTEEYRQFTEKQMKKLKEEEETKILTKAQKKKLRKKRAEEKKKQEEEIREKEESGLALNNITEEFLTKEFDKKIKVPRAVGSLNIIQKNSDSNIESMANILSDIPIEQREDDSKRAREFYVPYFLKFTAITTYPAFIRIMTIIKEYKQEQRVKYVKIKQREPKSNLEQFVRDLALYFSGDKSFPTYIKSEKAFETFFGKDSSKARLELFGVLNYYLNGKTIMEYGTFINYIFYGFLMSRANLKYFLDFKKFNLKKIDYKDYFPPEEMAGFWKNIMNYEEKNKEYNEKINKLYSLLISKFKAFKTSIVGDENLNFDNKEFLNTFFSKNLEERNKILEKYFDFLKTFNTVISYYSTTDGKIAFLHSLPLQGEKLTQLTEMTNREEVSDFIEDKLMDMFKDEYGDY